MEGYVSKGPGNRWTIQVRAEGKPGEVGDFSASLGPDGGASIFGLTYEDLKANGPGKIELPEE